MSVKYLSPDPVPVQENATYNDLTKQINMYLYIQRNASLNMVILPTLTRQYAATKFQKNSPNPQTTRSKADEGDKSLNRRHKLYYP